MARVLYLGAPLNAQLPENSNVSDVMHATGNNTGNLLIGNAIRRHLKAEHISGDISLDPKFMEENFDYIVIGASNFLFPGFDFTPYSELLEAVNLPCVIIGLGAQAPRYGCRVEIPEGTRRMVKIISERSTSLGVRGNFTAATLIEMGINNVRVIGCPSMYWSCRPTLQFTRRVSSQALAVSVNGSANVIQHSMDADAAAQLESALFRIAFENGYPYVLQNEEQMMEIAAGHGGGSDEKLVQSLMVQYGLTGVMPEKFVRFLREHSKTYTDVEQWHADMQRFDFVLGSRFHGCLIAILAGVPAFVFVHDTRTREMCEVLNIPHVEVTKANGVDVRALYESLDLDAMQTTYRYLFQNYVNFLEENKIEHRLSRSV